MNLREIIGGHEVMPHSRPYMAFITYDGNKGRCGGFLIQYKFVLTAAHCWNRSMTVTLGAHNISEQERTQQIIPVEKASPHPAYNPRDHTNDIMLLKTELIIQEDRQCKKRFRHYSETTEICAGDPKKIQYIFKGDSGGPLVCDNKAYGVVSYGKNRTISSGIFTKVVHFLPWISRNMRLL
ncbi:Granzyme E [Apodemus speciosus]|uniref:Granzyme E n=1 Tax=Apodemus speciosus TaxID=105296 RepID=A0ABQ0FIA8_APOSI